MSKKPPYRVPSMSDVASVAPNGLRVVSTFSGCGGNCLGFRMAGYQIVWANEFIPQAAATYRANNPDTILDTRDIRTIAPADILAATGLGVGEIDVLDGSPPCSSFSMAGKREKLWSRAKAYSDSTQRTDDLFFEFIRILKGLQPRAFVAENVSGLVRGTAKGYFLLILAALKDAGYRVRCQIVDASWLGVPQTRKRVIFIGIRNDLNREPVFPKPRPYQYTLADVLPVAGIIEPESNMERFAVGKEWHRLLPGRKSNKYFQLVRPALTAPCPTITATASNTGAASVCYPTECRKFSVAETKALCSFPADFILTGNYAQQIERLGRAVPPLMMAHIAEAVKAVLK